MDNFEANVVRSFREAKKDMLEMKNQILRLAENQENLKKTVLGLRKKTKKVKAAKPKKVKDRHGHRRP